MKRWKLSPIDLESRTKYVEYGKARDRMLEATHTKHAPWTLVDFDDQKRGRLVLIRDLLDRLPDTQVPEEPIEFVPLPGATGEGTVPGGARADRRWAQVTQVCAVTPVFAVQAR